MHALFARTAVLACLASAVVSCAGPVSQRDFSYSPGSQLTVVAVIDGDFLAALPQDDHFADFSRFAPVSIAFRPDQMLVIADDASERAYGLPLDPGLPRTVYTAGVPLTDPHFLRTDPIGNVYAADGAQRKVEVIDTRFRSAGDVIPPFDALGLVQGRISGVAFGPAGELFLSDPTNARVYRFDPSGKFLASFDGGEEVGWGQLTQPEGIATAAGGTELYVCDAGKRQVAVFDPSGMPLRVFGGTDLVEPWGIAVSMHGQSFVADRKGQAICIFDAQGRLLEKLEGPPSGSSNWLGPTDVVIHDSSLVVADPPSGRVVIMKLAPPE